MRIASEDVKNWVTAVSIVVGGLWVLYEWNTLFPKTESEVTISTATLRTRAHGDLAVTFVALPDGELPMTSDGKFFYEACPETEAKSLPVRLPVRAFLNLTSSAPIPVRVEVVDFLVADVVAQTPKIEDGNEAPIFIADALSDVKTTPLASEAFVGGLRWTHVEPQGRSALAVLGTVSLPFSCGFGGSSWTPAEFAIGLTATVQTVGAEGQLGEAIKRHFFQVCRVLVDGSGTCSGNPPNASTDDSAPQKVIAQ